MKMMKIWIVVVILGIISIFYLKYWTPGKRSVKEEEFNQYKNYILVKETYYTGTGWAILGDENGYYELEQRKDVVLTGQKLPYAKVGHNINVFLCVVESSEKVEHMAFEELVDSYNIVEWHPVYPVVRNSVLPSWLLPKSLMNKQEIEYY